VNGPIAKPHARTLRKFALVALKVAVSVTILSYLFYQAWQDDSFRTLYERTKQWPLLALALVVALTAVALTIVRWYVLVRALDIPFTLRDAIRLGFLGFLFSLLALGVVGGDAIKAAFLARSLKARRTEAVATVVVDRLLGLYALVLLASAAFLFFYVDPANVKDPSELALLQRVCRVTVGLTIAGGVAMGIMLLPGFSTWPIWEWLTRLPWAGPFIARLVEALRMYRRRVGRMAAMLLLSIVTHAMFAVSVYFVAHGLGSDAPTLGAHLVVVPISLVASALPLGAFEYILDVTYHAVSPAGAVERQGFVIALAFRLIMLGVATVGIAYWLIGRREVRELVQEAREEQAA